MTYFIFMKDQVALVQGHLSSIQDELDQNDSFMRMISSVHSLSILLWEEKKVALSTNSYEKIGSYHEYIHQYLLHFWHSSSDLWAAYVKDRMSPEEAVHFFIDSILLGADFDFLEKVFSGEKYVSIAYDYMVNKNKIFWPQAHRLRTALAVWILQLLANKRFTQYYKKLPKPILQYLYCEIYMGHSYRETLSSSYYSSSNFYLLVPGWDQPCVQRHIKSIYYYMTLVEAIERYQQICTFHSVEKKTLVKDEHHFFSAKLVALSDVAMIFWFCSQDNALLIEQKMFFMHDVCQYVQNLLAEALKKIILNKNEILHVLSTERGGFLIAPMVIFLFKKDELLQSLQKLLSEHFTCKLNSSEELLPVEELLLQQVIELL